MSVEEHRIVGAFMALTLTCIALIGGLLWLLHRRLDDLEDR